INPKTGFPASDFVSVTIFAKNAAFADAIATATAIMGPEKGLIFLDSLAIGGIIYYEESGQLQRIESNGE
ncbi:FAD:protein FMN transferase, partial [candidate division WOR-3 bacterium]|nr:FAD:protein FMN transferase [candidate division WOR-3 bacterium]